MTQEKANHRADEIEELAHRLLEHAQHLRSPNSGSELERIFWPESTGNLSHIAAILLDARRKRLHHLEGSILGEPAWDMLLAIFRAVKTGTYLTVDQVCQVSGTSPSTAQRWLAVLANQSLVSVGDRADDDKGTPVRLTELGEIRMTKLLVDLRDEFIKRGGFGPGLI